MIFKPGQTTAYGEPWLVRTTLRFLNRSPAMSIRLVWEGGQLVVVKEAEPGSPQAQALAREARALKELASLPGLPRLIRATDGQLTRQYLPGQTLHALRSQRPLPRPQLAAWLTQLRALLELIHAKGWWHGDLSPDNLLIGPDQQLSLLDWGGPHWGTPPYALPGQHGPPSDERALSVLAQELLGDTELPVGHECLRLVGREAEMARLLRAWQAAPYQESTWVGVSAPSGGGKTSLLRELLWHAPHFAWGQGTTLATPVSYVLFQSLLENAHWPLSPHEMEESRWRQFALTFPAAEPHQTHRDLPQSAMAPLLLAEAWCDVLRARCQLQPLLLIMDDVQWMDESSRSLLVSLSQRAIPGLMVVLAWRQEELEWPAQIPLRFRLDLAPLQAEQVLQWAQSDAVPLHQQEAKQLTEWTQGSPLLISEWLRQPERPQFSAKAGLLLQHRVAEIPGPIRQVLQLAALMGSEFELEPLTLAGDAAAAVAWGEQHQLLLPGPRFSHDQVREALLSELDPGQRRHYHARLADFYQAQEARPQLCAFHYWEAGQPEQAAPFALQAARLERNCSGLSSAAYFYRLHARALPSPQTTLEMAQVLHLLGGHLEASEWLQRALELPGADPWKAEIYLALGENVLAVGHHEEAYHYAEKSWLHLGRASQNRPLQGRLITMQIESSFRRNVKRLWADALKWLPVVWRYSRQDCILRANLLLILGYLGLSQKTRWARAQLLKKVRGAGDPLAEIKVAARLSLFGFEKSDGRSHQRRLRALASSFEQLGDPTDLVLVYLMQVFYAGVRGDFADLHHLGQKIHQLSVLTLDDGQAAMALHCQILAGGARVSWQKLARKKPSEQGSFLAVYLNLAQAQYLLRQGQAAVAYRQLGDCSNHMPVSQAMIFAWTASAARQAGEATPRRWGQLRAGYFRKALRAAGQSLKVGPLGRIYWFRARREMALALLGLGRGAEAQPCLRQSIEEAACYGATYEEALSRQTWGRVGAELGWPQAEQEAERAVALLERLGAWWELVPPAAGLPLEEVGEAAHRYLQQPDAESRDQLCRWAGSPWVEHLDVARERSQRVRQELLEAQKQLQQESDRWCGFLTRGPVAVQRFDADGSCLEGESPTDGAPVRVELEGGEYAVLTLPVAHAQFSLCQCLLDSEVSYLQQRLWGHGRQAQLLAESSMKDMLVQGLRGLQSWHLGSEPVVLEEAWFWPGLEICRHGEIPWPRLGPQSRSALLAILREALQNVRKHRQAGPIELAFAVDGSHLSMRLSGSGGSGDGASNRRSFGLESMRFRASLAGGQLRVGDDFSLGLRLPLRFS